MPLRNQQRKLSSQIAPLMPENIRKHPEVSRGFHAARQIFVGSLTAKQLAKLKPTKLKEFYDGVAAFIDLCLYQNSQSSLPLEERQLAAIRLGVVLEIMPKAVQCVFPHPVSIFLREMRKEAGGTRGTAYLNLRT